MRRTSLAGFLAFALPAIGSAQVLTYKYDDGVFRHGQGSSGYAVQIAQKFELQRYGRIRWLEACFWRGTTDPNPAHSFTFDIHTPSGDVPGASRTGGNKPTVRQNLDRDNVTYCKRTSYNHAVPAGDTWISVRFLGDDGIIQSGSVGDGKLLAVDQSRPRIGGTKIRSIRLEGGRAVAGPWGNGFLGLFHFPVGIRIGVEHGGAPPPSPPNPNPPPVESPCAPTTDVLHFDGGYRVRMCYVTPDGDTGQAQAGIWASGQSGLLWFFDRGNAEALVKVLDGCGVNGHRWVYVAPVTDLGFELRVTGPTGQTWIHTNSTGRTASAKSDTAAFRC